MFLPSFQSDLKRSNFHLFCFERISKLCKPETKIMAALCQWYKGSYYRNTRFHDTQLFQKIKLWRVILSCREFQESTAFLEKRRYFCLIQYYFGKRLFSKSNESSFSWSWCRLFYLRLLSHAGHIFVTTVVICHEFKNVNSMKIWNKNDCYWC